MTVDLHNPVSTAHLEDLQDRLFAALASAPCPTGEASRDQAHIEALVEMVRAMDRGALTTKDVLDAFAHRRVPGFNFGRWVVEMVDEGVYLEAVFDEAA